MAALRVVLPWSMWPMVPTLTCGLVRVKTSLAMKQLRKGALCVPDGRTRPRACGHTGGCCQQDTRGKEHVRGGEPTRVSGRVAHDAPGGSRRSARPVASPRIDRIAVGVGHVQAP